MRCVETTNKGYVLRGLLEEVESSKGLVVMFHGFTGHMNENGYLFKVLSDELAKNGFSSLRYDFMGSGISDGYFKDMTFRTELKDAINIIEHAMEIKKDQPLIVLGFSMGGAVAGCMSSHFQNKIDKLILAAPAGCMDEHARAYFERSTRWVDDRNIDMGGYLMCYDFADSFEGLDLFGGIENFTNPVFIIHGEADQSVPIEYGRKYASIYKNASFHQVNGASHCFTDILHRKEFNEEIIKFLSK
jgi:pimeloyl-ACP methyl ester carboxylesterase